MTRREPLHVLIAGAGVAALEAALALRALAEERVTIELLAPEESFTYRPLAVTEPFRVGEVGRFPLRRLVEEAGAQLTTGSLASVDADSRRISTTEGVQLAYDVLLLALGSRPREAFPGAMTFRGPEDGPAFAEILSDARTGRARKIVFALPVGVAWPLPLYELALLTGINLSEAGVDAQIAVVTPEPTPLKIFGAEASDALRELLEIRGIELHAGTVPIAVESGMLRVAPEGFVPADRVVALPILEGLRFPGIPQGRDGFLPTDEHGRVVGLENVYAAGDITSFPVKQGGIAAQQADAASEAIAALAGASLTPSPFRPVLRGLLLTGLQPRYLRLGAKGASGIDTQPLWWPPAKIVGRYLAPFLAQHIGLSESPPPGLEAAAVPVEVELDSESAGVWTQV